MRERRPTSTRSSPQAQAAPCSQAACRRPDPARRPLHSCTGTAGDRRKGAREKKEKESEYIQPHHREAAAASRRSHHAAPRRRRRASGSRRVRRPRPGSPHAGTRRHRTTCRRSEKNRTAERREGAGGARVGQGALRASRHARHGQTRRQHQLRGWWRMGMLRWQREAVDGLCASAGAEAILVRHARLLELRCKVPCEHATNESPEGVTDNEGWTHPLGFRKATRRPTQGEGRRHAANGHPPHCPGGCGDARWWRQKVQQQSRGQGQSAVLLAHEPCVAWQWCIGSGCGESVCRAECEGLSSDGLRRPRPAPPRAAEARASPLLLGGWCAFSGGFGSAGECSNEGLRGDRCRGRKKLTSLLPPNVHARVGPRAKGARSAAAACRKRT